MASETVNKPGNEGSQRDRKLTAADRQRRALELRSQGWGYDRIASELGYRGRSGPWRAVNRALAKLQHEGVTELRSLHSLRLSEIVSSLWDRRRDPQVARAILGCMERESKLFGLDEPSKLEIGRLLLSDDWIRARDVIVAALEPHPAALEAVVEALKGIEE